MKLGEVSCVRAEVALEREVPGRELAASNLESKRPNDERGDNKLPIVVASLSLCYIVVPCSLHEHFWFQDQVSSFPIPVSEFHISKIHSNFHIPVFPGYRNQVPGSIAKWC